MEKFDCAPVSKFGSNPTCWRTFELLRLRNDQYIRSSRYTLSKRCANCCKNGRVVVLTGVPCLVPASWRALLIFVCWYAESHVSERWCGVFRSFRLCLR